MATLQSVPGALSPTFTESTSWMPGIVLGAAADAVNIVNIMKKAGLSRQGIDHLTLPVRSFSGREKVLEQQFSNFWSQGPFILLKLLRIQRAFTYDACVYHIRN